MSIEQLYGAWRIEEAPCRHKRDHPYGFPNTHWLILDDRAVVLRDILPEPLHFDFRVRVDDSVTPHECGIAGKHGGSGYYDIDDGLLFIGLGLNGGRPPRFASDCGNFFTFSRDHTFIVPATPKWPRTDIVSESLGRLVWDHGEPEYMGNWRGEAPLPDNTRCEIWASDYLIPLHHYLPLLELTYKWLRDHLPEVKAVCSERVAEWVDEDEEYCDLSMKEIATTITVDVIDGNNGEVHLWASTSIPIDHSIRVFLDVQDESIRATGASIEG